MPPAPAGTREEPDEGRRDGSDQQVAAAPHTGEAPMSSRAPRRFPALVAASVAATLALGVIGPGVAWAAPERPENVHSGQFFPKAGLRCGGQELNTGSQGFGPFELKQQSWIYYNCGDRTVRRKADVSRGFDGRCMGIGPGQARVLSAIWEPIVAATGYRGSKAC